MHYFKNKELLIILMKWKEDLKTNNEKEMPPELCHAMIQFANKMCSRFNFRDYTYRDLMEGEIIETLWKRTLNFDPEKSQNLFGYWSAIAFNAAVQVIKREKKEQNKKVQMLREMDIDSLINDETADPESIQEFVEYLRSYSDDKDSKSSYEQPSKPVKLIKTKPGQFDKILEGI